MVPNSVSVTGSGVASGGGAMPSGASGSRSAAATETDTIAHAISVWTARIGYMLQPPSTT